MDRIKDILLLTDYIIHTLIMTIHEHNYELPLWHDLSMLIWCKMKRDRSRLPHNCTYFTSNIKTRCTCMYVYYVYLNRRSYNIVIS